MPNFMKFYKNPEVARRIRNKERKKNYQSTQGNRPRKWTKTEDEKVLEHEISDRELAGRISRSAEAIQIRRCRLKQRQTKGSE